MIVQVRPFGDAIYKSKYFPWSKYISGKQGRSPGYDPLKIMVDVAHKNGMKVEAWVKFHNVECFGFSAKGLPESILVLPITLYLLPVTWFYGVELVVPSIDKRLYERLPQIYNSYSKSMDLLRKNGMAK